MDWLKFFPLAWRYDRKPKEVQGPYFPALKQNKWFLTDSLIRFLAPAANPVIGFSGRGRSVDALSPGSANILKAEWKRESGGARDAPKNNWEQDLFYSNTWYFVGPWFSGFQARLTADALLISAGRNSAYAEKNFFHPRVFESVIANYLDISYGYYRNGSKPKFRGPLNWRVSPISASIQAVVCDIHEIGDGTKENPLLHRQVFFPVTPSKMIGINFDFGGTQIYRDEVCAKPLFKLCDSIIETFRMEVGEKTQAEWDKVKATCPDMSVSSTFGELPWPIPTEKPVTAPKEIDITPGQDALSHQRT